MVSILDAGLTSIFGGIFVFLLVYTVVCGALSWKKIFGDKPGIYAMIALTIALLMSIAPPARNFLMFIAPWYIAFFFVLFFILFIVSLFGMGSDTRPGIIKDATVHTWIIIICVVILLAGLAFTFGQQALETGQNLPPNIQQNIPPGIGVIGGDQMPQVDSNGNPIDTSQYPTGGGYPAAGQPGSTNTPNFQTNLMNTLLHPKVLGMAITMLIAAVSVYFLSRQD